MLTDNAILSRIGMRLRSDQLRQNLTQEVLAEEAGVSLSSVKKIEKGTVGSFDSLLRVMRTLGRLGVLLPLIEEEQMSPNEYYKVVNSIERNTRKRASRNNRQRKEDAEW